MCNDEIRTQVRLYHHITVCPVYLLHDCIVCRILARKSLSLGSEKAEKDYNNPINLSSLPIFGVSLSKQIFVDLEI